MKTTYLFGTGLLVAALVVACGSGNASTLGNGTGGDNSGGANGGTNNGNGNASNGSTSNSQLPPGGGSGTVSNPTGEQFYTANVHPFLAANCGTCHDTAGPGPNWIIKADPATTYKMLFQLGFVVASSPILNQGPHDGQTTNVLTQAQATTFSQWINMELTAGGATATPDVLAKIATCMDETKFLAIGLDQIRTIQRTNNNNTNNVTPWAENANRCTGCNQAPCKDCHTSDSASGFMMAIGYNGTINGQTAQDYTFDQTKIASPAFIQKYFGLDTSGNPIASNAIQNKSLATSKDVAYTHPYFTLTATQITAIQAFVDDAVANYKAGTCTGTAAPPN